MSSDTEMSGSDSPVLNLDPAITASVRPGPERAVCNHREYIRHPGICAAQDPSVIWDLGEEYERNHKRFWRCGICKKTKMLVIQKGASSALRHLKKGHKIDKQGRRIRTDQMIIVEAATIVAQTIAQVVSLFNANTFRYLSQLPHLAMGLSRPVGYPWAGQAFLAGL